MTQYKVEALAFFPQMTFDKDAVVRSSQGKIQQVLDDYVRRGWRLVSTNATDSGSALYVYLYFESGGSAT
jgi:hypothetical protein